MGEKDPRLVFEKFVKSCHELNNRLELADLIESNGNAADVINYISRFHDSFRRKYGSLTKFEFKQVIINEKI